MATPYPPNESFDVIVIGAGPAGLVLGRELERRGLSHCLLERGESAGESWRRMPSNLTLVSPWKASVLPGKTLRRWTGHRAVGRADYLGYLRDYAQAGHMPIRTGTEVHAVRRSSPASFLVETSCGPLTGRFIVNATGYFQNPFRPPIAGASETSIPQWHVAEIDRPEFLVKRLAQKNPTVLIVGKRLSAGQSLVELNDAGFSVALSHRSPIRFGSGPVGWWIFFRIHPWIEALKLRLQGPTAGGFEVRMQGGRARHLITSGMIRRFPDLAAFEQNRVVFANGNSLSPDAVVYATGYQPVLKHLEQLKLSRDATTGLPRTASFQSIDQPGLFFLGLDHVRNFQSRFLRGIRNDGPELAILLARELGRH